MLDYKDFQVLRNLGVVKVFCQFKKKYYSKYKLVNKIDFCYSLEYRSHIIDLDYYKYIDMICLLCNYHTALLNEKFKLLGIIDNTIMNHYKRQKRLIDRINFIFANYENPVFVTLTFNDTYINCKSHRKFVVDFLKSQCGCYVANIDYGKINNRMHYHAVCSCHISPTSWIYGACNVRVINIADSEVLAKYINKLGNHATKNTTKGFKCIYSRLEKS